MVTCKGSGREGNGSHWVCKYSYRWPPKERDHAQPRLLSLSVERPWRGFFRHLWVAGLHGIQDLDTFGHLWEDQKVWVRPNKLFLRNYIIASLTVNTIWAKKNAKVKLNIGQNGCAKMSFALLKFSSASLGSSFGTLLVPEAQGSAKKPDKRKKMNYFRPKYEK